MTQQPNPLYRIHWYAGLTGATGHGTGAFPRDIAQQWADELNSDKDNRALLMHHWIELVGEPDAAPQEAGK